MDKNKTSVAFAILTELQVMTVSDQDQINRMIGERLRIRRKEANMTQDQLGDAIGISGAMVGAIERGERRLQLSVAFKSAPVLNCHVDDLLPPHYLHDEEITRILEMYERIAPDKRKAFVSALANLIEAFQ